MTYVKSFRPLLLAWLIFPSIASGAFFGVSQNRLNPEQGLIANGASSYVIVLPSDAIPSEQTAANELSDYLYQATGVRLAIISEEGYRNEQKMLAIGFNKFLPSNLSEGSFGYMDPEEIVIAADGEVVLLAGGRPRGALYAVYEFLHRLGVRWFTPEYTKVPAKAVVMLPDSVYRYNPPFVGRSQLVGNAPTSIWNARNRLNSQRLWKSLPEHLGSGYSQGPDMHTFRHIISRQVLEQHPEWLAMVDGRRELPVGTEWGLCLSTISLRKYLVQKTLDWARKNPEKDAVWISQNDGSEFCNCSQCNEFYENHGGQPSSLVVLLVNEMAMALEREMPGKMAKTLAYTWSLDAPANIKVHDNAMIMFCADGSYIMPIHQDPDQARLRIAIDNWRTVAKNLDVYLYSAPFDSYWFAEPSTFSAAENIKWAYHNEISSIYTHVSGYGDTYGSQSMDLRAWLYARLCWDPNQDIGLLTADFIENYYGPAADAVRYSTELIHKDVLDADGKIQTFNDSEVVPNHVNPEAIRKINKIFESTFDKLTESIYKKRLGLEWLPYLWTDFWLGFSEAGKYDEDLGTWKIPLDEAIPRLDYGLRAKDLMIEHGVSALREKLPLNPESIDLDKYGVSWDALRLTDLNTKMVVVPEIGGKIVDFVDHRTDFSPLKAYWGYAMTAYPKIGYWRDRIDGIDIDAYTIIDKEENRKFISLQSASDHGTVKKNVALKSDVLHIKLKARPNESRPIELQSSFMLDLQDDRFGKNPKIYVQRLNGSWDRYLPGEGSNFWYFTNSIDLKGTSGRIIIASETRKEGVLIEFEQDDITHIDYEYDVFDHYPADQARMMWISPTKKVSNGEELDEVSLAFSIQILLDVSQEL